MVKGWHNSLRLYFSKREEGVATRREARLALGLLLVVIIISLIGWLYLTQASQVTATGYHIQELEMEKARLERACALLRLEIAELESLPRIEARARELGFGPAQNVRYLVVSAPPQEQDLQPWHRPESAPEDTLWEAVLSQLKAWLMAGR